MGNWPVGVAPNSIPIKWRLYGLILDLQFFLFGEFSRKVTHILNTRNSRTGWDEDVEQSFISNRNFVGKLIHPNPYSIGVDSTAQLSCVAEFSLHLRKRHLILASPARRDVLGPVSF